MPKLTLGPFDVPFDNSLCGRCQRLGDVKHPSKHALTVHGVGKSDPATLKCVCQWRVPVRLKEARPYLHLGRGVEV